MKGGNGVREANVVTLCLKCEITYCVSRTSARMAPALGRLAGTRKSSFADFPHRPAGSRLSQPPKKFFTTKNTKKSLKL